MSLGYVLRRLGYMVVTFWIALTVVFLLFRLLPGNPAQVLVNPLSPPEIQAQVLHELGLDRPLLVQYGLYLRNLARGDLGVSYFQNEPVLRIIPIYFANSLVLAILTFLFAYGLGTLLGVILAWGRGTRWESAMSMLVLIVRGSPPFFTGIILITVFSLRLDWLPVSGMITAGLPTRELGSYLTLDFLRHLVLPVASATLYAMGLPLLLVRNTMLGVLGEEYIELARAKGLGEIAVMFRHAARNALLPVVAEGAQFMGWAMGGMVTIEFIFSWPGVGWTLVTSLASRDYPLAQGAFLCIILLVLFMYFISDLVSAYLDPRVRFS